MTDLRDFQVSFAGFFRQVVSSLQVHPELR